MREVIREKRDFYGRSVLGSAAEKCMPDRALAFGRYRLEPRVGLIAGDREVRLMPKALALLSYMASRPGEVIAKETDSAFGVPLVTVNVRMTNQDGGVLVDATAEVELPL